MGGSRQTTRPAFWNVAWGTVFTILVTGGIVEAAKSLKLLGWLETRVAATVSLLAGPRIDEELEGFHESLPRVVLIDDTAYETIFRSTSPLDRAYLRDLINQVQAKAPALIALDLDISPYSGDEEQDAKPLYQSLCKTARPELAAVPDCLAAAAASRPEICRGTPIVLIETHATGETARAVARDWERRFAQALGPCLSFASSDIQMQHNRAVYFSDDFGTLGVRAYTTLMKSDTRLASEPSDANRLLNTVLIEAAGYDRRLPRSIAGYLLARPSWQDGGLTLTGNTDFTNKAVFIGGGWGHDDKYNTAYADNIDGVLVHASVFFSLRRPLGAAPLTAFAIDFAFSLIAGFILHFIWARYHRANNRFRRLAGRQAFSPMIAALTLRPEARPYYAVRILWLTAAWTFLILALGAILIFTSLILRNNLWISPAALVIGLFIDKLFSSRPSDDPVHDDEPEHTIPALPQDSLHLAGSFLWTLRWVSAGAFLVFGLWENLVSHWV